MPTSLPEDLPYRPRCRAKLAIAAIITQCYALSSDPEKSNGNRYRNARVSRALGGRPFILGAESAARIGRRVVVANSVPLSAQSGIAQAICQDLHRFYNLLFGVIGRNEEA